MWALPLERVARYFELHDQIVPVVCTVSGVARNASAGASVSGLGRLHVAARGYHCEDGDIPARGRSGEPERRSQLQLIQLLQAHGGGTPELECRRPGNGIDQQLRAIERGLR